MKYKNILYYATCVFLLNACSTSNNLKSGVFTTTYNYNINSYFGCCGCEAKYFTINKGKSPIEQIIYSYNCYNEGSPMKFIFNYNKKGQIVSCEKYIGTVNNDYTLPLTEQEIFILSLVKNDSTLKPKFAEREFYEIKGFRKPLEGEIAHSFPLIKNGIKLPIK
jgi:hypothetical protein